eukprot:gene5524-9341_t
MLYVPKQMKNDCDFVLDLVVWNHYPIQNISEDFLKKNRIIISKYLNKHAEGYQYIPEFAQNDVEFIELALRQNPSVYSLIPTRYQEDEKLILKCVPSWGVPKILSNLPKKMIDDKFFMMACLRRNGFSFNFVSPRLQIDYDIILQASKLEKRILSGINPELKSFDLFWIHLVNDIEDQSVLEYADRRLFNDRNFVLQLSSIRGMCLKYAAEELQGDEEIVAEAIKNDDGILMGEEFSTPFSFASKELKNNKKFALEAVKKNILNLFVLQDLKLDMEVIWIAKKYHKFIRNIRTENVNFKFR